MIYRKASYHTAQWDAKLIESHSCSTTRPPQKGTNNKIIKEA